MKNLDNSKEKGLIYPSLSIFIKVPNGVFDDFFTQQGWFCLSL
jgi:hypothetical protein